MQRRNALTGHVTSGRRLDDVREQHQGKTLHRKFAAAPHGGADDVTGGELQAEPEPERLRAGAGVGGSRAD